MNNIVFNSASHVPAEIKDRGQIDPNPGGKMTACLPGVRLLNARHASGASLRRHAASNKREGVTTRTGERKQNSTRGSRRGSESKTLRRNVKMLMPGIIS